MFTNAAPTVRPALRRMSSFEDQPFSESHLDSPAYRKRLLRKLNTLIAVLEVACAKVRRSLASPEADTDRLERIQKNLTETLQVCLRAKTALERSEKLPEDLPAGLTRLSPQSESPDSEVDASGDSLRGSAVEMSSRDEAEKFERLGPIDAQEIRACDLDDLCGRLLERD